MYDAQMIPKILNEYTNIAVGDSHYGASVMREKIWKEYGTIIVAPPHYKQKKKVLTWWQDLLLKARPKVEAVFDYLKEHSINIKKIENNLIVELGKGNKTIMIVAHVDTVSLTQGWTIEPFNPQEKDGKIYF